MNRKKTRTLSELAAVGIIFTMIGVFFVVMGIFLWNIPYDSEANLLGTIFTWIGAGFLVCAAVLLIAERARQRQFRRLVESGRYIWGEVADFVPNYNVRINNRYPYTVLVRYADPNGSIHIFRSENLRTYPDRSIIGKQVRIYIQDESFKRYYIDLEGVLPHVIQH